MSEEDRGDEFVRRRVGIGGDGIGEEIVGRPTAGRLGQAGREIVSSPSTPEAVDGPDAGPVLAALCTQPCVCWMSAKRPGSRSRRSPSRPDRLVDKSSSSAASVRSNSVCHRARGARRVARALPSLPGGPPQPRACRAASVGRFGPLRPALAPSRTCRSTARGPTGPPRSRAGRWCSHAFEGRRALRQLGLCVVQRTDGHGSRCAAAAPAAGGPGAPWPNGTGTPSRGRLLERHQASSAWSWQPSSCISPTGCRRKASIAGPKARRPGPPAGWSRERRRRSR